MRNTYKRRTAGLGPAEQAVMEHLWAHGPSSADDCRGALERRWPMKDSTLRTLLRRLEGKGFVEHTVEGRTFIYRAVERRSGAAARAVRHIIDRFLGGSAEDLVLGLVDHDVLTPQQLDRLAKTVAARKRAKR